MLEVSIVVTTVFKILHYQRLHAYFINMHHVKVSIHFKETYILK